MKPIHNLNDTSGVCVSVVIPHKVNDLNETNSQQFRDMQIQFNRCDSSQS